MENADGTRKTEPATRVHAPQYVQNLYDRIAFEIDDDDGQTFTGRRRRSVNGASYNFGSGGTATKIGDESVTIQAVARDHHVMRKLSEFFVLGRSQQDV